MTMDDAFDARLKAAFAAAQQPLDEEAEARRFADTVTARLSKPDRKRAIILGGAGSTGSAIAGTQLEGLFGAAQGGATDIAADGAMETALGLLGAFGTPEVMAAAALALAAGAVVLILPRRLIPT